MMANSERRPVGEVGPPSGEERIGEGRIDGQPQSMVSARPGATSRGRWLVVGLLVFGSLATGAISTYWKVRLGPFSPYRRALKAAFPDGAPVVEGGNLPGQPSVLRVVLKVGFSPTAEDARTMEVAKQVQDLANELDSDGQYHKLLLYLMKPRPQQKPERLEVVLPLHDPQPSGSQGR